ncbi:hypothetical protein FQA39_LY16079 [Lamprigera yunnana]|nr:hypothetical protein FQA39_LY16079 [Lamprigera yunnana]
MMIIIIGTPTSIPLVQLQHNLSEEFNQRRKVIIQDLFKRMKTLDDAVKLEQELENVVLFNNIIKHMNLQLSEDLRGFNCCYLLVDLFFERSFFGLCSWSGHSVLKPFKYPFKSFSRIINCFFECVRCIDTNFNFSDCELFFKKKVLKHSAQRQKSNCSRPSRMKQRPTGIVNKKSKRFYKKVAKETSKRDGRSGNRI